MGILLNQRHCCSFKIVKSIYAYCQRHRFREWHLLTARKRSFLGQGNVLPPANEVWGKVIFSVVCVKNSVYRGVCLSACWDTTPLRSRPPGTRHSPKPPKADPPGPGTPPDPPGTRHPPPLEQTPQDQVPLCSACWDIWSTSRQYASYWNAILLYLCVILFKGGGLTSQHA